MTNLRKLSNEIESQEFALILGVASGMKTLQSIALSTSQVVQLQEKLKNSPLEVFIFLLRRILKIAETTIDRRYVNPFDFALTIYLFILNTHTPFFAKIAANLVLNIPECWWAAKMSKEVLDVKPSETGEAVVSYSTLFIPPLKKQTEGVVDSSYYLTLIPKIEKIEAGPLTNVPFRFQPTPKASWRKDIRKERFLRDRELFEDQFPIRERNSSENTPILTVDLE